MLLRLKVIFFLMSGCLVFTRHTGDSLKYHNGQAFTTKDRDNDKWKSVKHKNNCGIYRQSAWWHGDGCGYSNLTGTYIKGGQNSHNGMFWYHWKGIHSLKSSSMMIRRLKKHVN